MKEATVDIQLPLPKRFILNWEEFYDDDDNTYWEASGPYWSEEDGSEYFRIRQKLISNVICFIDDSDKIYQGHEIYGESYTCEDLTIMMNDMQEHCDEIWDSILKQQEQNTNVDKETPTFKKNVVTWPDRVGYWWVRDENWMDLARSYIYNDPEQEEDTYAIKLSIGDNLTEDNFEDSPEFIWLGESFDSLKENLTLDKQYT